MSSCPCIIRCPTHRATSTVLAQTLRTAETVQKLSLELNAILAEAVSPAGVAVTREDLIAVLRAIMEDLDHFGEIHIHTIEQVRQVMARVDGQPSESSNEVMF